MFVYYVGVHDRRVLDQVQRIGVSEIHINKRAMTKGFGNDIALIKLSRPALRYIKAWLSQPVHSKYKGGGLSQ